MALVLDKGAVEVSGRSRGRPSKELLPDCAGKTGAAESPCRNEICLPSPRITFYSFFAMTARDRQEPGLTRLPLRVELHVKRNQGQLLTGRWDHRATRKHLPRQQLTAVQDELGLKLNSVQSAVIVSYRITSNEPTPELEGTNVSAFASINS